MRACRVVPQGRELKTLALSIKQMLVTGVLHQPCFPSRVENFPAWCFLSPFATLVISKASEIEEKKNLKLEAT